MVELEKHTVPRLQNHISFRKRYVDDTFTFVKDEANICLRKTELLLLKFTVHLRIINQILITGKNSTIETTGYRKKTTTNIYLNWFSLAPNTLKRGALKMLNCAYKVC